MQWQVETMWFRLKLQDYSWLVLECMAMAGRDVVIFAINRGLDDLIVAGDALGVIQAINEGPIPLEIQQYSSL